MLVLLRSMTKMQLSLPWKSCICYTYGDTYTNHIPGMP